MRLSCPCVGCTALVIYCCRRLVSWMQKPRSCSPRHNLNHIKYATSPGFATSVLNLSYLIAFKSLEVTRRHHERYGISHLTNAYVMATLAGRWKRRIAFNSECRKPPFGLRLHSGIRPARDFFTSPARTDFTYESNQTGVRNKQGVCGLSLLIIAFFV